MGDRERVMQFYIKVFSFRLPVMKELQVSNLCEKEFIQFSNEIEKFEKLETLHIVECNLNTKAVDAFHERIEGTHVRPSQVRNLREIHLADTTPLENFPRLT